MSNKFLEIGKYSYLKLADKIPLDSVVFIKDLVDYFELLERKKKIKIVGMLSNTVVNPYISDKDIIGIARKKIRNLDDIEKNIKVYSDGHVIVNCLVPLGVLVNFLLRKGYNIWHLFGIPGTIGGAVVNNSGSGSLGLSIFDNIEWIEYYDNGGKKYIETRSEILFSKRTTKFKHGFNFFIWKVCLKFKKDNNENLNKVKELVLKKKLSLSYIYKYPSLGSFFILPKRIGLRNFFMENGFLIYKNKLINFNIHNNYFEFLNFRKYILSCYPFWEEEIEVVDFSKEVYYYVGLILYDKNGSLILQQRDNDKNIRNFGKVTFFGGRVNNGEGIKQALQREIKEELNIDLKFDRLKFEGIYLKENKESKMLGYIFSYYTNNIDEFLFQITCNEGRPVVKYYESFESLKKDDSLTSYCKKVLNYFYRRLGFWQL